ncbi:TM0106 family RecB-like putative nuclease [Cellulosimicrobium cellulans]|uniref:TM0106 family RecB-like putative nuclease n=1 Tax=Cellulosimicrobium cellulans TaxID=1710 RepID=UPI0020985371|nr:bifunctional RecB family nuclease/DEAD/DEAH box helicase [Cellulosimicrobium cellulans]MCO7274937.1 TM0106 family RecB-like putative nuclease [Cellulosimicrobium cellulans]
MFLVDEPALRTVAADPGRTATSGAPARDRVLVHSASDLVVAADCEYRLLCRLDEQLGRAPRPDDAEDAMLARTAALGARHEHEVLARYEAEHGAFDPTTGRGVVRLEPPRGVSWDELVAAQARTLAALEAGADVVHQATFFDGSFHGRADFLVRTGTDDAGAARYAVVDTKLARRAKVPALLQLAAYGDQLQAAGVPVDPDVSLVLGTRERTSHRLADLLPVFRDRRDRLVRLTAEHVARDGRAPWDDPAVRACGRCADCRAQIESHRDVLLVGGVYESQRARLHAAGIRTIDELAAATDETPVPEGMSRSTFATVRRQAALQLGTGPSDGTVVWADASGPHELSWRIDDPAPVLALPAPSPGDVFFDFEGDPLWTDEGGTSWGLDYLFGWVERPAAPEDRPVFHALWAHDLAAERDALVAFVDHVNARRRTYPDLHVYHYADYERAHLLAIAARHGVYEEEVDDLLRDGVLVDLYAVVRQALRVSDKSRSIKKLEPLYMGDELRTGDVTTAAASVVAYAEYTALREAGRDDEADELLRGIADYNRYDCVSTLRLADWLRHAVLTSEVVASGAGSGETRAVYHPHPRPSDAPARPATTARVFPDPALSVTSPGGEIAPDRRGGDLADVEPRERASAVVLEEEIREVVGEDRARRGADERALALYGAAAGYFRREAKPFWHEHYSRLSLPVDEWLGRRNAFLVEEAEVVSGWEVEPGRRTWSRRLALVGRLPEGSDLRVGVAPYVLYDPPLPPCAKTAADGVRGWLTGASIVDAMRRATAAGDRDVLVVREQLPTGAEPFDATPVALTPSPGPSAKRLEAAAEAAARTALRTWRTTGTLPLDAATDVLLRRRPRLVSAPAAPADGLRAPEGSDGARLPKDADGVVAPGLPSVVDGDVVAAVTAAVERLDDSYLAVQGPPGTGKTYVGSRVVARLVARGWRVGVVAQSHAVVENMLRAVVLGAGVPREVVAKKIAADGPSTRAVYDELDGAHLAAFATQPGPRVVGGTAWDFAADRLPAGTLDLLVVDEAGQLSLATTVAVARAARRLLLLGDPQQLPQVSQGRHPEPVDRSALGWLADGHGVLPPGRGYFLPTTWRMHPRLAQAVSTLAYEDRLHAHPCTAARDLDGVPPGIEQVLVEHAGNSVRSPEEAAEVVRQVERVLGRTWTTTVDGVEERRPLGQGDVLVVAAYNAQVWAVRGALEAAGYPDVQVGTVDRFQGKEAPVVVVTLAASSGRDASRGLGFLLSRHRVNVAVSRAQWRAVVVRSPGLTDALPHSPRGVEELGAFLGLTGSAPLG